MPQDVEKFLCPEGQLGYSCDPVAVTGPLGVFLDPPGFVAVTRKPCLLVAMGRLEPFVASRRDGDKIMSIIRLLLVALSRFYPLSIVARRCGETGYPWCSSLCRNFDPARQLMRIFALISAAFNENMP
jgi:hypothetical protein